VRDEDLDLILVEAVPGEHPAFGFELLQAARRAGL